MRRVDMRPVYHWTCDNCGRECPERLPVRQLDPADAADWHCIVERVEGDLERLFDMAGGVGDGDETPPPDGSAVRLPIFPKNGLKLLKRIVRAARGEPVGAYTARMVPGTVTCRDCGTTYETKFGAMVRGSSADDGADDDGFDAF